MTVAPSEIIVLIRGTANTIFFYQEVALFFFFVFIILVLAKMHVDRFATIFIITITAGASAYYGITNSPLIWGIALIGGGFITFHAVRMLFSES